MSHNPQPSPPNNPSPSLLHTTPSLSHTPATPSTTTTTQLQTPTPSRVPQAGLLAARALLAHNQRVSSFSRSSAPRKKMSIRDAATKWGASKTAIARHLKALTETNKPFASDKPPGRPRALTASEEEALAAFCVYLAQGNCMGNIPLVHKAANELRARRQPPMGPCHRRWVCRWLMERRDLTMENIPRADRQYRVEGDEGVVVREFFDQYFKERMERDRVVLEERLASTPGGRRGGGGLTPGGRTTAGEGFAPARVGGAAAEQLRETLPMPGCLEL
ncbi:hypothetical protein GE09DRAFT_1090669 [Coniochaeta sp. 2T2.1]|nr:hypothetical protein GE09DRAFT_1090669 [Coniochaeta sp. 2T2.1]